MKYSISIFAPESAAIGASGSWQVTADSAEQAMRMARFYTDPCLWPVGSTWVIVPLDASGDECEIGIWDG